MAKILKSTLPYTQPETENLCRFLSNGLDTHSDKTLLIHAESDRRWSGAKIKEAALRLASILVERADLKKGQVCSVFIDQDDRVFISMVAIIMAGGVFQYLDKASFTGRDLRDTTVEVKSKVLISDTATLATIADQLGDQRDHLKVISLDNEVPELFDSTRSFSVANLLDEIHKSSAQNSMTIPESLPNWDDIQPANDIAVIQFSTGTTGKPKAIPRTHQNCCHLVASVDHDEMIGMRPGIVISGILSFIYRPGIWAAFTCITKGATHVMLNLKSTPDHIVDVIEKYGVTDYFATVLVLASLADIDPNKLAGRNLSTLKNVVTAGSKIVNKGAVERVIEKFKLETLRQGFGMTESGFVFLAPKSSSHGMCMSVGHVCPGMEAKIVNRETRQLLPPEAPGEIALRGPQIFPGYLTGTPGQLNRSDFDHEGWFYIGDQGHYDSEGFVYIDGRYKELLSLESGGKFYPTSIEALITEHPAVESACVIKVSTREGTDLDIAKAFVTLNSNYDQLITGEDIRMHVTNQSRRVVLSGGIEIIAQFPRMPNGKIDKRALARMS